MISFFFFIQEIELFRDFLLHKPALLVINKMDSNVACDKFNDIKDKLHDLKSKYCFLVSDFNSFLINFLNILSDTILEYPSQIRPSKTMEFDEIIPISAKTSMSDVENLKHKLRNYLDMYAAEDDENSEEELLRRLRNNQENSAIKYV